MATKILVFFFFIDGTDIIDYKPVRHRLMMNVTEVGSQRDPNSKTPFLEVNTILITFLIVKTYVALFFYEVVTYEVVCLG